MVNAVKEFIFRNIVNDKCEMESLLLSSKTHKESIGIIEGIAIWRTKEREDYKAGKQNQFPPSSDN